MSVPSAFWRHRPRAFPRPFRVARSVPHRAGQMGRPHGRLRRSRRRSIRACGAPFVGRSAPGCRVTRPLRPRPPSSLTTTLVAKDGPGSRDRIARASDERTSDDSGAIPFRADGPDVELTHTRRRLMVESRPGGAGTLGSRGRWAGGSHHRRVPRVGRWPDRDRQVTGLG